MTLQDLPTGLPAATRTVRQRSRAGVLRLACCASLLAACVPAFAQPANNAPPAASPQLLLTTPSTPTPAPVKVRPIFGDLAELEPGTTVVLDAPATATPGITDRIQALLAKATTLLGTPYRWGGESPENGFDCSGLVGYVYRTVLGMDLPRVSRQMATTGEKVDRTALAPGDLVFFGRRGRVNHVGIYVGEGRFLHAPSRGKDVRVDSMTTGYWGGRFLQGRRVAM